MLTADSISRGVSGMIIICSIISASVVTAKKEVIVSSSELYFFKLSTVLRHDMLALFFIVQILQR